MRTTASSALVLALAAAAPLLAASGCSDPNPTTEADNSSGVPQAAGVLPANAALPNNAPGSQDNFNSTGSPATDGNVPAGTANPNAINEGTGNPSNVGDSSGTTNADTNTNDGSNGTPTTEGAPQQAVPPQEMMQDAMGAGGAGMATAPSNSVASAGCGQSTGTPPPDLIANNFITFPPGYDGSTPMPLVFGFHGAGRTNIEQREVDSRTEEGILEQNYIVAYMKAAGDAWNTGSDLPRFNQAREEIFAQLCVDTSGVFAFGHSSGAQFITQMLGSTQTNLTGVVVVASSSFNNFPWDPIPTLSIHGLQDRSRGGDPDGTIDLVQYTTSNQCSEQTQAVNVTACNSIAGENPAVDSGCRQYVGCAQPTIFCNHNDPNYIDNGNPTNHGWPCFANDEIFKFFENLR